MQKFTLTQGLGDCIVAGASLQRLAINTGEKVGFHTSPLLKPVFENHPYIELLDSPEDCKQLLWPSQTEPVVQSTLWKIHTMQRFSVQLGFTIAPYDVLKIYDEQGKILNKPTEDIVCINQYSGERNRRYIPDEYVEFIDCAATSLGYRVVRLGDEVRDIQSCINYLRNCRLFVGPISFQYHLASTMGTKCLTFFSYMPPNYYSHFYNTIPVESYRSCVPFCEELEKTMRDREDCWGGCKAVEYDKNFIYDKLNELL